MIKKMIVTEKRRTELLKRTPIFRGIPEEDISQIIVLADAKDGLYEKGECFLHEGDRLPAFGIILKGALQSSIMRENGHRAILRTHHEAELIADDFVFGGVRACPWDFYAMEDTWIVWIEMPHSMEVLTRKCQNHTRLLHNMIRIMAQKNVALLQRTDILSQKSMREKVMSYLKMEAEKAGGRAFEIPFTRDEMADYLGTDRSALSRLLAALKKENVIDFEKNNFRINF